MIQFLKYKKILMEQNLSIRELITPKIKLDEENKLQTEFEDEIEESEPEEPDFTDFKNFEE